MESEDWTGPGCAGMTMAPKPSVGFPGIEWTEDGCPGWAARSPAVCEVAEAFTAFEAGALRELVPNISNPVAEGVLELKRAMGEYERIQTSLLKESAKNNG